VLLEQGIICSVATGETAQIDYLVKRDSAKILFVSLPCGISCLARLQYAKGVAIAAQTSIGGRVSRTVGLLNIEPLGAIMCGGNTQDHSDISRYSPRVDMTQVAHYLARLW
jgi:hypothetical protein